MLAPYDIQNTSESNEEIKYQNVEESISKVLLVNNLPKCVNAVNLFNLFSCFGNIQKIKILQSKEGSALIEYENVGQAISSMEHLQGCPLFGQKLNVSSAHIVSVNIPKHTDGKSMDFSKSQLNRYMIKGSKNCKNINPRK